MKWDKRFLGEVASFDRKGISPEDIKTGTFYVGLENIAGEGNFSEVKEISKGELASTKFVFNEKHLLYGKLRPYLKKIACPNFSGICSTDILPILVGKDLDKNFLYHYLRLPEMIGLANARCSGINLPRLSPKILAEFEIPLPPLPEQKRIAEVLDKADALWEKRRLALQKLDTLLQSVFLEMFGDPVKNPKGWETVKVQDIAKVGTGSTPSRLEPNNFGGNISWVKTTEVNGKEIKATEEHLTEIGLHSSSCKIYPKKSIVIAMYGQGLTRGRCAILGIEATTNQACAVILPSPKYITEYLFVLLKFSYENLRNLGRGGNQPNLNLNIVKEYKIPLPPLALQQKFAETYLKISDVKMKLNKTLNYSENLFQSLQQRAFKGELFSNEFPSAEPQEEKVWEQTSLF